MKGKKIKDSHRFRTIYKNAKYVDLDYNGVMRCSMFESTQAWDSAYDLIEFLNDLFKPSKIKAKCYIYGASSSGFLLSSILERFNVQIIGFIDKNSLSGNMPGMNYKVYSVYDEIETDAHIFVCAAPVHYDSIIEEYLYHQKFKQLVFLWKAQNRDSTVLNSPGLEGEVPPNAIFNRAMTLYESTLIYIKKNMPDDALKCFQQAESLNQNITTYDFIAPVIYALQGSGQKAVIEFNRSVGDSSEKKGHSIYYHDLEYVQREVARLIKGNFFGQAQTVIEQAVSLHGRNNVLDNIQGIIWFKTQNYIKAVDAFNSAYKADAEDLISGLNSAFMEYDFYSIGECRKLCIKLSEKDPGNEKLKKILFNVDNRSRSFKTLEFKNDVISDTIENPISSLPPYRILNSLSGSGTHFLSAIISNVIKKCPTSISQEAVKNMAYDEFTNSITNEIETGRVFPLHLYYSKYSRITEDKSKNMRMVMMFRHPLDAMITRFRFQSDFYDKSKSNWVDALKKQIRVKGWFSSDLDDALIMWLKDGRVLPVRYEDFISDPMNELTLICDYMEIDYEENDLIRAVAENFYYVTPAFELQRYPMHNAPSSEGNPRGTPGEWEKVFDKADVDAIRKEIGDRMDYLGYPL